MLRLGRSAVAFRGGGQDLRVSAEMTDFSWVLLLLPAALEEAPHQKSNKICTSFGVQKQHLQEDNDRSFGSDSNALDV